MTARLEVTPKTTEQNRIVRTSKSEAEVINKKLRSRYCTIDATKLTTDRREVSRGLFATAELFGLLEHIYCRPYDSTRNSSVGPRWDIRYTNVTCRKFHRLKHAMVVKGNGHFPRRTSPRTDISPSRHQAPDISPAHLRTFPPFIIHSFIWPLFRRIVTFFKRLKIRPWNANNMKPYPSFVMVQLSMTLSDHNVIAWPWKLGYVLFKVIENAWIVRSYILTGVISNDFERPSVTWQNFYDTKNRAASLQLLSFLCVILINLDRKQWFCGAYIVAAYIRSADTTDYAVPRTRTKFGERAFYVARPSTWNSLSLPSLWEGLTVLRLLNAVWKRTF